MKKSYIRKVSKKMARQKTEERKLTQKLLDKSDGLCQHCHRLPDWRGLSKHELIFRSHGGSAVDEINTILICGRCHNHFHNIKEV